MSVNPSEAARLLSEYLRIDSTNPPGDTTACVEWLRAQLAASGIESTILGFDAEAPSLVATVGDGDEALVLHHHMDVVPVDGQDWTVAPFAGEIIDGYVYGRGALDMKGFGILCLLTLNEVAQRSGDLRRPLRFLATSDEEVGGTRGAAFLSSNHLPETGGAFLWTEGSFATIAGGEVTYPIQTAETGVAAIELTATGRPGHASMDNAENPVTRLVGAVERIVRAKLAFKPTPTVLNAGGSFNVVPAVATCTFDIRVPPGVTQEQVIAQLLDSAGRPLWLSAEVARWSDPTFSPEDSQLMTAMENAIRSERPEAEITTVQGRIGTDARPYRGQGVVCYGLVPFELDENELKGMHGTDERVSIENLERGLRIMRRVVETLCL